MAVAVAVSVHLEFSNVHRLFRCKTILTQLVYYQGLKDKLGKRGCVCSFVIFQRALFRYKTILT